MAIEILERTDYPSSNPDIHPLIDAALDQGWRVDLTNGGHVRFLPRDRSQRPTFTSQSPSDWRAWRNLRSRLRRTGLKI